MTNVIRGFCKQNDLKKIGPDCGNLTIFDPKAFYPIQWNNWKELYRDTTSKDSSSKNIEHSFSVHLWNKLSTPIEEAPENSLLKRLAKEHCPITNSLFME